MPLLTLGRDLVPAEKYDLIGIPCVHVVAVLMHMNVDILEYVHPWYSKHAYGLTYQHMITPILDKARGLKMNMILLCRPLREPNLVG